MNIDSIIAGLGAPSWAGSRPYTAQGAVSPLPQISVAPRPFSLTAAPPGPSLAPVSIPASSPSISAVSPPLADALVGLGGGASEDNYNAGAENPLPGDPGFGGASNDQNRSTAPQVQGTSAGTGYSTEIDLSGLSALSGRGGFAAGLLANQFVPGAALAISTLGSVGNIAQANNRIEDYLPGERPLGFGDWASDMGNRMTFGAVGTSAGQKAGQIRSDFERDDPVGQMINSHSTGGGTPTYSVDFTGLQGPTLDAALHELELFQNSEALLRAEQQALAAIEAGLYESQSNGQFDFSGYDYGSGYGYDPSYSSEW